METSMSNTNDTMVSNDTMDPNELAIQAAGVDLDSTSWLDSTILLEKIRNLKDLCLGNCRLLYGSERFKFYDIVVCESEEKKSFGAILTCNQDGQTKILRTVGHKDPVTAVRELVQGLQRDTSLLFPKYTIGSQLEGQQGYTNKDTKKFELRDAARDKRICGPDDDTAGLARSWSDAPGGSGRHPPRGRNDGANGYEGGAHKRRAVEQPARPSGFLDYGDGS